MNTTTAERNKIKGEEGYIFVDDGGSGNLPVVFTHSFGGDVSHWANQLSHIRETRRAVALDFRGHGKSDASRNSHFAAESLANDIVAIVDELDLDKFVLVGHSMGGSAAIAYADSHANRVAGLVLAGTPGKTPVEISTQVVTSLQSDKYQQVMDDYMEKLVADAKPAVATKVKKGVKKLSRETSTKIIQAQFEFDPIEMIKRYKGPKLIIQTSNEQKQPNSLHNQVPDVQAKVIDGTSHWPQMDKPEIFNQILDDFLRQIE
jgi:pimeloyl-ACP methyl ester carboxylesterase